jgi:transposase
MPPKKRRLFTDEQKAEAVRIALASDKSIGQVAREMDLTQSALHNWVRQSQTNQKQAPQGALTTDERAELLRLRRDLKRVQMERDFLKKAAAFFARESSDLTN